MIKSVPNEEWLKDLDAVDEQTRNVLLVLCKKFDGELKRILLDEEACKLYHSLMLRVIRKKETNQGNFTAHGMSYTLDKNWEDIKNEYGGTTYLPLF